MRPQKNHAYHAPYRPKKRGYFPLFSGRVSTPCGGTFKTHKPWFARVFSFSQARSDTLGHAQTRFAPYLAPYFGLAPYIAFSGRFRWFFNGLFPVLVEYHEVVILGHSFAVAKPGIANMARKSLF